MKILLVNTNRMKPVVAPLGLDYLADSLRADGHALSLLDLCFSDNCEKDIDSAVSGFDPELVGMSVRNTDDCVLSSGAFLLPEVRRMVSAMRQFTDAPVVLGGVGFSTMPEAAVEYCGADFAIARRRRRILPPPGPRPAERLRAGGRAGAPVVGRGRAAAQSRRRAPPGRAAAP